MNIYASKYASGAVSLFVVIFTAILLTGITVGFTILMLSDQERATDNDLSQSARDSAEAGIEDAKRVLAQFNACQLDASASTNCGDIITAVSSGRCNTISRALGETGEAERKVLQSEGDQQLDQAYTCVTINPDTDAFVGQTRDESDMRFIPLQGTEAFDTVEISWLDRSDVPDDANFSVSREGSGADSRISLPRSGEDWRGGSVLRVGVVRHGEENINVRQVDDSARTAFFYAGTGTQTDFNLTDSSLDAHKPIYNDPEENEAVVPTDARNVVHQAGCEGVGTNGRLNRDGGYLCKTTIRVKENADQTDKVYLTLASMYRATSFSIVLKNSAQPDSEIKFQGVQPEIDATGRANDVFRRVVARVEAVGGESAPFPRAAVGSSGSLCKSFTVTDNANDYSQDSAAQSGTGCYNLSTGNSY